MFSVLQFPQSEEWTRSTKPGSTIQSRRGFRRAAGLARSHEKEVRQMMAVRTRSVEAFFASVMVAFGIIFTIPGETMKRAGWELMREWTQVFPGSEWGLGFILMAVGTVRICALIVNGRWYPTPVARFVGCVVGSLFWTSCAVSFIAGSGDAVPTHLAWDLSAIAFEWFSAMRAVSDMHLMDSLGLRARAERNVRP